MAVVPNEFPSPQEPAVASFSYNDIANAAGYVTYYGQANWDSGSALAYSLITTPVEAQDTYTEQAPSQDNTYTFDVTFNQPRILNGDCYVVVPYFAKAVSTSAITVTVYASLFHYDGSTETQIGSTVSDSYTLNVTSTTQHDELLSAIIEPSNETKFKLNDVLRLKVRIVTSSSANANSRGALWHDPTGSSVTGSELGDSRTHTLSVEIPYKIDI